MNGQNSLNLELMLYRIKLSITVKEATIKFVAQKEKVQLITI